MLADVRRGGHGVARHIKQAANVEAIEKGGQYMPEAGKIANLGQKPLVGAPFWLVILVLWGVMELAWRWRRVRARIS